MTLKATVLVGNPKPKSRTMAVGELLAKRILAGTDHAIQVIDLADYADDIFKWPSDRMSQLNAEAASSDLLVVASPTYKATYTGLLKSFLDRYPANGLKGVPAVSVMTGADLTHSMAPGVNLNPLLVELGACVPVRGLYVVTSTLDRIDEIVNAAAEEYLQTYGLLNFINARATGSAVNAAKTPAAIS